MTNVLLERINYIQLHVHITTHIWAFKTPYLWAVPVPLKRGPFFSRPFQIWAFMEKMCSPLLLIQVSSMHGNWNTSSTPLPCYFAGKDHVSGQIDTVSSIYLQWRHFRCSQIHYVYTSSLYRYGSLSYDVKQLQMRTVCFCMKNFYVAITISNSK